MEGRSIPKHVDETATVVDSSNARVGCRHLLLLEVLNKLVCSLHCVCYVTALKVTLEVVEPTGQLQRSIGEALQTILLIVDVCSTEGLYLFRVRVEDNSKVEDSAPPLHVRQEVLHAFAQAPRLAEDLFRVALACLGQLLRRFDQFVRIRDRVLKIETQDQFIFLNF